MSDPDGALPFVVGLGLLLVLTALFWVFAMRTKRELDALGSVWGEYAASRGLTFTPHSAGHVIGPGVGKPPRIHGNVDGVAIEISALEVRGRDRKMTRVAAPVPGWVPEGGGVYAARKTGAWGEGLFMPTTTTGDAQIDERFFTGSTPHELSAVLVAKPMRERLIGSSLRTLRCYRAHGQSGAHVDFLGPAYVSAAEELDLAVAILTSLHRG
jgi:hypothetical protein